MIFFIDNILITKKGGLKMLDINKFIMSLKCSWIRRLIVGHSSWTSILKAINGEDFVNWLLDFGDAFISRYFDT